MIYLFSSAKLFIFGAFCDAFASLCTRMAEDAILKNKPLNKKLLIHMSNFSNNCLVFWQASERRFIKSVKDFRRLP